MSPTHLTLGNWASSNTVTMSAYAFSQEAACRYDASFLETSTPSGTDSAQSFEIPEPDLIPYECSRSSGVLKFWDDESEDIYTSEDGIPL